MFLLWCKSKVIKKFKSICYTHKADIYNIFSVYCNSKNFIFQSFSVAYFTFFFNHKSVFQFLFGCIGKSFVISFFQIFYYSFKFSHSVERKFGRLKVKSEFFICSVKNNIELFFWNIFHRNSVIYIKITAH